ncbi:MAG: glucosamine-6-phosphate deaminase [Planctomycetes bacterium]|nr:glucosamine-6-phosphate deaminase [Planctomycetota bacterium]
MEVVILTDPAAVGVCVADAICRLFASKERVNLGLATGSSPLATYAELIRRHAEEGLSLKGMTAFMLDEYLGLPVGHPESYRTYLERSFVDLVDLPNDSLLGPDVATRRPDVACREYEEQIRAAGGIDLQLLGIGSDGHIGFNEPMSSLASRTRIKTLTEETRRDNARFFGGDVEAVPRHVITQGIGTLLEARHLVLIATGEKKAGCIQRALEGPIAAMVPATALQLHPHVTVVLDQAAAGQLALRGYHEETFRTKPDWQGL